MLPEKSFYVATIERKRKKIFKIKHYGSTFLVYEKNENIHVKTKSLTESSSDGTIETNIRKTKLLDMKMKF